MAVRAVGFAAEASQPLSPAAMCSSARPPKTENEVPVYVPTALLLDNTQGTLAQVLDNSSVDLMHPLEPIGTGNVSDTSATKPPAGGSTAMHVPSCMKDDTRSQSYAAIFTATAAPPLAVPLIAADGTTSDAEGRDIVVLPPPEPGLTLVLLLADSLSN